MRIQPNLVVTVRMSQGNCSTSALIRLFKIGDALYPSDRPVGWWMARLAELETDEPVPDEPGLKAKSDPTLESARYDSITIEE